MRAYLGSGNYYRGRGATALQRGDDEFPEVNMSDLEPLPWVSGEPDAPVSTLGGRVCKPHARFCPHKPPCKGL